MGICIRCRRSLTHGSERHWREGRSGKEGQRLVQQGRAQPCLRAEAALRTHTRTGSLALLCSLMSPGLACFAFPRNCPLISTSAFSIQTLKPMLFSILFSFDYFEKKKKVWTQLHLISRRRNGTMWQPIHGVTVPDFEVSLRVRVSQRYSICLARTWPWVQSSLPHTHENRGLP